jgi:pilus assembly protein CpaF
VTREVAAGLTDADAANGDAGEFLAAALIRDALDRIERDRLVHGQEPLGDEREAEVDRRVRARLFGMADLERLLEDPEVENVFLNGPATVIVVRADGSQEFVDPIVSSNDELNELLQNLAASQGRSERRFDVGHPEMSIRLQDGSRLSAVRELSGHTVAALRRHRYRDVDVERLYQLGSISAALRSLLPAAVRGKLNVLVVGGTNAGKTTILRACANEIPACERVITIEDALELHLSANPARHPNVVELECREANVEGQGAYTMRQLTKQALRLSPDRVIVGEVRGPEILDMLQAMSQGNDGSLGTLHARSSLDAFVQILRYALRAPEQLTAEAVAVDVASCLNLVVHVHQLRDGRRVISSVREVTGFHGATVQSNEVLAPDRIGRAVPTGTGFTDPVAARLADAGFGHSLLTVGDGGWTW